MSSVSNEEQIDSASQNKLVFEEKQTDANDSVGSVKVDDVNILSDEKSN